MRRVLFGLLRLLPARAASPVAPLALLLAALAFAAPASAAELVSNLGQATGTTTYNVTGNHWHAQRFTTGANADGYALTDVELDFHTAPASDISVKIVSGLTTSSVGTDVATLTNPATLSTGTLTFTAPANTTLDASTEYAVVVNDGDPGKLKTTTGTGQSGATGWTIADQRSHRTTGNWAHHSNIIKIRVNGSTDTTVPTLQSTVVDGSTLRLNYSEALDTGSVPATGSFAVTVATASRTVSTVAVAGQTVTLTLSSAATGGQAVTVAYTKPASNPIQDAAGNDAAAFTSQTVHNFTGDPTGPSLSKATFDGDRITLRYNERLDTASVPDPGQFLVLVTGQANPVVSAVTISVASVTLTLPSALASSATVTVSYSLPLLSNEKHIRDLAQNNADTLSGQSVTHADITAPTVDSATVDGKKLDITFSETLATTSTPISEAFTVTATPSGGTARTIRGVNSAVTISGATVTVTLLSAVLDGETVTVTYNKGSTTINDPSSNSVETFTNQAVTNNSMAPTFDSATVNGTSLVVTFSETLATTSTPVSEAFTVTVTPSGGSATNIKGANSAVTIAGAAVTVTLVSAVSARDDVTVAYTKGPTTINDTTGNSVETFTNKAVTNNSPDTVKPSLSTATFDGNRITLTYNEALDANSVPAPGQFVVTVTPGANQVPTAVTISGSTVTLTLGTALASSATVDLSYAKPTSNPIQDLAGNDAASLSNQSVTHADITAPTVSGAPSVTSDPSSDNTYTVGDTISVKVTFDENVTVTGTPQLELAVGANNRQADYASGSGSTELTFSYTVVAGDADSDGISVGANKLTLNSGTIKDAADNNATLTHTALAAQSGHKVDGVVPTLDSATVDGATLTLNYNEALDTNSTPAGTDFTVSVAGTDQTPTGVTVAGSAVTLTLGTAATFGQTVTVTYTVPTGAGANPIRDLAQNNAADLSSQAVTNNTPSDTTAPTLDSATVNGTTLTLNYNEALDTSSTPATTDFTVSVATTDKTPSGVSVSGSSVILTLATADAVTVGQTVTVSYSAGTNPIRDVAQNNAGALSGQSVTNDTPDPATFPTLVGAPTSGTKLTLVFSKDLNTASAHIPAKGAFTISGTTTTVTTVAFRSGNARFLDLTLSAAIDGSAPTLAYAQPADATALQDSAGNKVAGFTGFAIDTPPTFLSAKVNGTRLDVTFNKALDANSRPANSRFNVRVRPSGSTNDADWQNIAGAASGTVSISDATATATLASAVRHDQEVEVGYGAGNDTNPLKGTAATTNDVNGFIDQPVGNITPNPKPRFVSTVRGMTLPLDEPADLELPAATTAAPTHTA